jgi:hypothetical protein
MFAHDAKSSTSVLEDAIEYECRSAPSSAAPRPAFVQLKLKRLFEYRNAVTLRAFGNALP